MQTSELIKYINNPQLLDKESVMRLQKLVNDFPYFQSAHVLLSMASKKWDTSIYQQSLKKTAIVSPNRAHLFKLIHALENAEPETTVVEKITVAETKTETIAGGTYTEDAKQELEILKATEVAAEALVFEKTEVLSEVKQIKTKPMLDAEQILEREIANEVVNSFVEKEILKTQEFSKPLIKEESPENFTDWLSFLKKNNGQSYREITKQVNQEKAKQEVVKQAPSSVFALEAQSTSAKNSDEPPPIELRKLKHKAIIDKIIESSPGLIRQKEEPQRFYTPDIKAKESLLENEHLVTETLAKIYALQGSINKAIRAYEILSIKYPQKRAYFDGLIQKLKHNA